MLAVVSLRAEERKKDLPGGNAQQQTFQYSLKGKVRLLLFWVGKDDVGGGHISLQQECPPHQDLCQEQIELLFGSKPERVPGKINRWGYAVERFFWPRGGSESQLVRSVFEGFMRHSKEEDLAEVQSNEGREKASGRFWYDATTSIVEKDKSVVQKHFFSAREDFDFRDLAKMQEAYRERKRGGPPDRVREVAHPHPRPPFGFLSGVRQLIRDITSSSQNRDRKEWSRLRPSLHYVFNGRSYRLWVRDLEWKDRFQLEDPGTSGSRLMVPDVVKAEFRLRREDTGNEHDFALWFPVRGPFAGVPLRIEDKPRWWLRLELNLIPDARFRDWLAQGSSAAAFSSSP